MRACDWWPGAPLPLGATNTHCCAHTLSGAGLLDLDADLYLAAYDQAVLLEWIDTMWSCFLEVRGLSFRPWCCVTGGEGPVLLEWVDIMWSCYLAPACDANQGPAGMLSLPPSYSTHITHT